MSPPKLKKRDSTLTQLGFYHSSSPAVETQWTIPATSDAEDEDEDYKEPRAKKRRKTSGSKPKPGGKKAKTDVSESQSTLTQNWRALGYVMDSYDTSDEEDLAMVDQGMQPPPSAQPKQARPLPRRRPAPNAGETQIQGDNMLGAYLDNDWSSESELESASKLSLTPSQLAHFAPSRDRESTRPTTADSKSTPKTPKRITKTEIPDSAETSSVPPSSRSVKPGPGCARSPLKERSTNVPSQRGISQDSQQATRRKVSFDQIQLDDANALKEPVGQWSAKLAFTPKRSQKGLSRSPQHQSMDSSPTLSQSTRRTSRENFSTAKKRTLERVSTIAESDESDVELADIEQPKFGVSSRQAGRTMHEDGNHSLSERSASENLTADLGQEVATLPLSGGLRAPAESLPSPGAHDSEMQTDSASTKRSAEESPSLSQDEVMLDSDTSVMQGTIYTGADVLTESAGLIILGSEDTLADKLAAANTRSEHPEGTDKAITIDDSEADEEFGEDGDYTEDDLDGSLNESNEHDDDDQEYTYNQTYDPVADALARDGARAWRTETQLQRDELEKANQETLTEESDEENEESNMGGNGIVVVPSSQDEEEIVPSSQDFADPGQKLAALGSPGRSAAGDIDDSGYASQEMLDEEVSKAPPQTMPPPWRPQQTILKLPRPSQVSTVVGDTLSQHSRPNSAQPWTEPSAPSSPPEVDAGLPEDPIERSPQKSYLQTLPSSPFPMPPGVLRRGRNDISETQSSGLMDFSLPPPPPLLLSSSRPQDGSSLR